jgi:hypothetical protein
MLDKIITVFQGFFSRAFWFGSFLPVAIIAAVHLCVAWLRYPNLVPLQDWATAKFESLTLFPAVFAILVVLAYALTPLIPLLRGVLDGSLLPERIHDWLRREHVICTRAARDGITAALETSAGYKRMINSEVTRLQAARAAGMGLPLPLPPGGPALIPPAEVAIEGFRTKVESGATPPLPEAQAAINALAAALAANPAVVPTGAPGADLAARLSEAHKLLIKLLRYAQTEADHRFQTAVARNSTLLAIKNPQATRMADARLLIESYSFNVYQADFDYIWPRLQLVLPEQQGGQAAPNAFAERLASSRSQVDFAVLSLALVFTVPAVWLPLLAVGAGPPWLFLAIGLASPFLAGFFYQLAVEAQIGFGEVVKSAIDANRLTLLKTLHQPLPATLSAERELWKKLRLAEEAADVNDLVYRYPTDTARPA